jgi:hypothetical protein
MVSAPSLTQLPTEIERGQMLSVVLTTYEGTSMVWHRCFDRLCLAGNRIVSLCDSIVISVLIPAAEH